MDASVWPARSSQSPRLVLPCWAFSPLQFSDCRVMRSSCTAPPRRARRAEWACAAGEEGGKRRLRRRPMKKQKAGAFANAIDDLTMKKYGRGYIYFGERKRLTDPNASGGDGEEEKEVPDSELLKPDPVLVVGGTGRTGQWITLGLLNQGFNVRVLTREFERAEKIFGPSGDNVDVFEGALEKPDSLADAVDGAVAVVFAAAPPWWAPGGAQAVDADGAAALIAAAKKAGSVRRFVLISAADRSGARGKAKRIAEEALRASGIPHVVVRPVELVAEEGGLREICMEPDHGSGTGGGGQLSRVDLAQVVCQALVHDRFINGMRAEDPDGGFEFPNCTVRVSNGDKPFVPDPNFWKKELSRITTAFAEDEGVAVAAQDGHSADVEESVN